MSMDPVTTTWAMAKAQQHLHQHQQRRERSPNPNSDACPPSKHAYPAPYMQALHNLSAFTAQHQTGLLFPSHLAPFLNIAQVTIHVFNHLLPALYHLFTSSYLPITLRNLILIMRSLLENRRFFFLHFSRFITRFNCKFDFILCQAVLATCKLPFNLPFLLFTSVYILACVWNINRV